MTKSEKLESTQEMETLKKWVKPGGTLYTILRHRAASGMSRVLDLYVIVDGEPLRLSWSASKVLGWTYNRNHEGILVRGCGLDVGYHLVYSLGRLLFADGFTCIGDKCPSNDHSNGDRNYEPHKHSDPGYSLRHGWL